MSTTKKKAIAFAGMVLCSMILLGCSDNQEKKQEEKATTTTTQEQIGKDVAQSMQKPIEEARKVADAVIEASQTLKDAVIDMPPANQQAGNEENKQEQIGQDAAQDTQKSVDEAPASDKKKKRVELEGC